MGSVAQSPAEDRARNREASSRGEKIELAEEGIWQVFGSELCSAIGRTLRVRVPGNPNQLLPWGTD
jgi:hypothetical protein